MECIIGGLMLSVPSDASRHVERIGDVVYLVDGCSEKPIYTFRFRGAAAGFSISRQMTQAMVDQSAALAKKLSDAETLKQSVSLLLMSLDSTTDDVLGFIAAWSALEVFINRTYKFKFKEQRLDSGKYCVSNIADKFCKIVSILDNDTAANDKEEFKRLKKIRDGFFHEFHKSSTSLPKDAVHILLLKYLRLYLSKQV